MNPPAQGLPRLRRACRWGAAAGLVPYLLVLWDFGFHPLRGATADHLNGHFYDVQARALLDGHLDVPPGSLGIEAFVVDGRHHMYFGPFPALLRLPLLALTDRFDGRLTALSMLAGWVVLAAALSALIIQVRTVLRADAAVSRFEAAGYGVLVAAVTGGSVLVYLASQPWVYHEVYVWSSALAIATVAGLVALWRRPTWGRAAGTSALALATMLTRLPAGWAMALALVATGVLVATRGASRRVGGALAGAGAAVAAAGSAVNWVRFHHVYRFPIEQHEWTRLSAHRRFVLLHNGGRIDGPQFFWTDLVAYLRPDGIRFVPYFPFVTFPARPPSPVWGVYLDESFRTGSVPAFMPLVFGLAVWGCLVAVRRSGPPGIGVLRVALVAALGVTGGVMAFGYVAPRYTAEFVTVLAVGGAIGFADVARRAAHWSVGARRTTLVAMAGLAAFGALANGAVGLMTARRNGRGDGLVAVLSLQERLSSLTGHPLSREIVHVDTLPPDAPADALAIVGDCDALYLGTGEASGAWVPVVLRPWGFRATVGPGGLQPGRAPLMAFRGYTERLLDLQVGLEGNVRLVVVGAPPDLGGAWLDAGPGDVVTVDVRADTAHSRFVATATVAGSAARSVVTAPMTEWDRRYSPTNIVPAVVATPAGGHRIGVTLETSRGPVPDLCARLAAH